VQARAASERGLHRVRPELDRGNVRQRAAKAPDGRASTTRQHRRRARIRGGLDWLHLAGHEDNARMAHVPLLVIGAGPYGLSTAAHAKRHGIDPLVVGDPMGFWRQNMPERMLLRSGTDWHLDADGIDTFEAYLRERGIDPSGVPPVPLRTFLEYADWFLERRGSSRIRRSSRASSTPMGGSWSALEDGRELTADAVVAAAGHRSLPGDPGLGAASLPEGRWSHTSALVRFEHLQGAGVLIVGGRQSAFEWAALLADAGAAQIHVVHRHDGPASRHRTGLRGRADGQHDRRPGLVSDTSPRLSVTRSLRGSGERGA
jgi:cation diffusion facilitator CzcD-associated flavoprotein CzcO